MKKRSSKTLGNALSNGRVHFAGHIEVRGGFYHEMWEAKVDGGLKEGAWLRLVREPNNPHDSNAIAVFSKQLMLGHVAKEQASWLHAFLDAGVRCALRVEFIVNQPLRATTRLYVQHARRR